MGSLTAALTDRCRVVRAVTAAKAEGRRVLHPVPREWTRCRLVPGGAPEQRDGQDRRTVLERGEVVVPPTADVKQGDTLEVESPMLGSSEWRVVGAPRVAGSARRARAQIVTVERTIGGQR